MDIWIDCYKLTKELPKDERFGLVSQINRASSSIPANVAEGSSRKSQKDNARFVQYALGSAFELETFFLGILKLNFLKEQSVNAVLEKITEEQKMLSGFLRKLNA